MAKKRKDQLETELATNFADNVTADITPLDQRTYMTNIMDSYDIRSAANTTYYVSTAGSDSNTGLGSGPTEALLTIQAALERAPKSIDDVITISVGAGTFDGFYVQGFQVGSNGGSLVVQGALGNPTLASGTATGTATGGSVSTLVDSSQSWTSNDFLGKWVLVDGEYRQVFINSATSITFVTSFSSSTSGKAYEILEPKTVINTREAQTNSSCIYVTGCIAAESSDCIIQNFDIQAPASTTYGLLVRGTSSAAVKNTRVSCASAGLYGVAYERVCGQYSLEEVTFVDDIDTAAVYLYQNPGQCSSLRGYIVAIDGRGALIDSCGVVKGVRLTPNACTGTGMRVVNTLRLDVDTLFVPSGSANGLEIANCNYVSLSGLSGSGSTGYGMRATKNASIEFNSIPSISGSSGDILFGDTILDWSDDFPNNGDQAIDSDLGLVLARDDSV